MIRTFAFPMVAVAMLLTSTAYASPEANSAIRKKVNVTGDLSLRKKVNVADAAGIIIIGGKKKY